MTSPELGLSVPQIRFRNVLLPAPFGPITHFISCAFRSSETSFVAVSPPKRLYKWCAESSFCVMACSRSEEHTSELQSLMRISYAVFCLKKKKQKQINTKITNCISTIHCYITNDITRI